MSLRRLVSVLSVGVVVASASAVVAQPKAAPKAAPKADPKAAAPAAPPAATPAAPAAGADAGSAVQPIEEPPPADMDGINENPDNPKTIGGDNNTSVTAVAPSKPTGGYPIEEAARPITLPQNMSEVSISPHAQVSPYMGADALRARYGITRQVQLGLTYVFGGVFDDPATTMTDKLGFHPGKAVGLDLTVLVQNWLGVKLGVPFYIDPVAVGVTVGAPMRFRLNDKLTIGGMDDLVTVTIEKFSPSLYQEGRNAAAAAAFDINTTKSRGLLRFSGYGIYQYQPKMALIGRLAVNMDDFSANRGTTGFGGIATEIRAGFQYTPKKYLDLGLSIGFDDLAHGGTFAPAGFLAVRI